MKNNKHLIVLTGPTASGKSSLSLNLAKKFSGEIISADSMQIYKHMNIGTAKVTKIEQETIPHHLIDFLDINETYSTARYTRDAHKIINEIHLKGKIPFLVGGTGLYISSVVDNIQFFSIKEDLDFRKELNDYAVVSGNKALWERLYEVDPNLANTLHINNKGRIIRGLEVYKTSGSTLSYWQKKSREKKSEYTSLVIGLAYRDRQLLYSKINDRVDEMLKDGLLDEVRHIYNMGISKTANQAIGYKELWSVLDGTISLEEGANQLKQNTRRYAKRQLTWMRGRKDLVWIYRDDFASNDDVIEYATNIIRKGIAGIEKTT